MADRVAHGETEARAGTRILQTHVPWGPSEFGPVTGNLRDWDVTDRLGEIRVPALVTGGRYDEARPAHVAVLADGIPGAELVIFENSSHMAFTEERERYLRVVDDFLTRTEAAELGAK